MNRWLDRLARRVVRHGRLEVTWADGTVSRYGDGEGHRAHIVFRDRAAQSAVLLDPEIGIGDGYMDGRIEFPDDSLLPFMLLMNDAARHMRNVPLFAFLSEFRFLTRRLAQNNTLTRARRNIHHHYDLDGRFYRLFLDPDLQYSCAYFEKPGIDLDEAQWAKKRHLAAKLALQPGQQVLDIGSGWGGLGLFLAELFDVNVTGVTLSDEQYDISNQRAHASGLGDKARFEMRDYRTLDTEFDRIVSVGMFEHVGTPYYGEFFNAAARLLKPDGVMLLHSIGRFGPPATTNRWIAKHIFPGGYIPALSEVMKAVERAGLFVADVEVLRLHYAETLKAWRERFRARWDEAAAIHDERFCRMWNLYLAGAEAAFRNGEMMVFQLQLVRDVAAVPITRDYMHDAESALRRDHARPDAVRLAGE
jgi:cyclopropane-fatty-acyl-phospholipid synthase